jgi:hypothetical protein
MNSKNSVDTLLNKISIIIIVVSVVALSWFLARSSWSDKADQALVVVPGEQKTVSNCEFARLLDGICVDNETLINPKLVGVMIENALEARPQYGLAEARIVYEAPVEANFTRFLAFFPADLTVSQVGPVRSARPYYLSWLAEYGTPMYMHVGGSNDALEIIKNTGVNDLNEFYRGWFYWRGKDRSAPHNVYTSSANWQKALADYESLYTKEFEQGWLFSEKSACVENCVSSVSIIFNGLAYSAQWRFSSSTQDYVRWQSREPHRDGKGKPITADTVIVQHVTSQVLDTTGRLAITTVGSGQAVVFRNGYAIVGTWAKENKTARTRWYDEAGVEILLKSGKIWVEVVNERAEVKY